MLAALLFCAAAVTSQSIGGLVAALTGLALCAAAPSAPQSMTRLRCSPGAGRAMRALLVLGVLGLLCTPARAEPATISVGTITAIVSALWEIFSTVITLIGYALIIIRFTSCWTLWFTITFVIFFGTLGALNRVDEDFGVTNFLDSILLSGAQCEPEDPDYGAYRPEKYKNDRRRHSLRQAKLDFVEAVHSGVSAARVTLGGALHSALVTGTRSMEGATDWLDNLMPAPSPLTAAHHQAELLALARAPFYAF